MADLLPDVTVGDPGHAAAHNDERHLINELLAVDPTIDVFRVKVWGLAGQSNEVSHGGPALDGSGALDTVYLDPPDPRIKQYAGSGPLFQKVVTAIDPLIHHEIQTGSVGHAMTFARYLLQTMRPGDSILLVPCAHSQTGFTTSSLASPPAGYSNAPGGGWDPSGAQGGINLYEYFISQLIGAINAAQALLTNIEVEFAGYLWTQGEADSSALTQSQYAVMFDTLDNGIRARVPGGTDIDTLIGPMLYERIVAGGGYTNIYNAHVDVPRRRTRTAYFYGAGPGYGNTASSGELHWNNPGQRLIGANAFQALAISQANVLGTPPVPPGLSLAQVGTSVLVTLQRTPGRVTDYRIRYSVNGGALTTFAHTATADITFTLPGFAFGNTIEVRASTINEQGTSDATVASLLLKNVPNAPTGLTATHTATSISPSWTPAATGDIARSFFIEYRTTGSSTWLPGPTVVGANTGIVTGLLVAQSYDYRITPSNEAGTGASASSSATTDPLNVLLTDIGVSAYRALSLRKVNSAYAGSCIKVRRSSDNTTQDIGFTGLGVIDEAALLTFVGSGFGYVDTWYDQSGNGRNVSNASTTGQPAIVLGGVVAKKNGKASMVFDGVDDILDTATVGLYAAGASTLLNVAELDTDFVAAVHLVAETQTTSGSFEQYSLTRIVTGGFLGANIANDAALPGNLTNGGVNIATGVLHQHAVVDTGTTHANYVNGATSKAPTAYTRGAPPATFNRHTIGAQEFHAVTVSGGWKGSVSEVVEFAVALTDPQRVAGGTNQRSYHSIT